MQSAVGVEVSGLKIWRCHDEDCGAWIPWYGNVSTRICYASHKGDAPLMVLDEIALAPSPPVEDAPKPAPIDLTPKEIDECARAGDETAERADVPALSRAVSLHATENILAGRDMASWASVRIAAVRAKADEIRARRSATTTTPIVLTPDERARVIAEANAEAVTGGDYGDEARLNHAQSTPTCGNQWCIVARRIAAKVLSERDKAKPWEHGHYWLRPEAKAGECVSCGEPGIERYEPGWPDSFYMCVACIVASGMKPIVAATNDDTFPRPPRDEAEREAARGPGTFDHPDSCRTYDEHDWLCNVPRGHSGDHIAVLSDGTVLARWPASHPPPVATEEEIEEVIQWLRHVRSGAGTQAISVDRALATVEKLAKGRRQMTSIEWTHPPGFKGATWNPVVGCRRVSPGCEHCYAETMAGRLARMGQARYLDVVKVDAKGQPRGRWNGTFREVPEVLDKPLRTRVPTCYFVNSMSDLFGEGVSDEYIAAVFGVMAACPQHRFQVLTKRAERLPKWFEWMRATVDNIRAHLPTVSIYPPDHWYHSQIVGAAEDVIGRIILPGDEEDAIPLPWPLPNVHIGVSVEDQQRADERIPHLFSIPAAVRFLSVEPQLGPVDLSRYARAVTGAVVATNGNKATLRLDGRALHWIIVGGESGPGARPFHVAWARSIVEQCKAAAVPVFCKQLGANVAWNGCAGTDEHWPPGIEKSDTGLGYWRVLLRDRKGGDMEEWPADLRVRQWPVTP